MLSGEATEGGRRARDVTARTGVPTDLLVLGSHSYITAEGELRDRRGTFHRHRQHRHPGESVPHRIRFFEIQINDFLISYVGAGHVSLDAVRSAWIRSLSSNLCSQV